jgi:hypothetical protein
MAPGVFGQPGAYGGNASFGHDSGQAGVGQPFPFGGQAPFGVQANPFAQNPYLPGVLATNPYAQSLWSLNSTAHNPLLSFGGSNPVSQFAPVLGHLAQQLAIQGAVTHQIGIALHQLTQQLVGQGAQGYPGVGFGGGQAFAGAGQPFGGAGGQYFGQNPFAGAAQGGYGGFNPQAQAWGANRPQTIQ